MTLMTLMSLRISSKHFLKNHMSGLSGQDHDEFCSWLSCSNFLPLLSNILNICWGKSSMMLKKKFIGSYRLLQPVWNKFHAVGLSPFDDEVFEHPCSLWYVNVARIKSVESLRGAIGWLKFRFLVDRGAVYLILYKPIYFSLTHFKKSNQNETSKSRFRDNRFNQCPSAISTLFFPTLWLMPKVFAIGCEK